MTRVAVPAETCAVLSRIAAQKAREDVMGRGWKSSGALQPASNKGEVGIRSTLKHLLYQNSGVKPYLMTWVNGKTVPLGCKMGDGPHFRTGKDVGKPGYVNIPHKGKVWRNQKWRYPGLEPKRFIESAMTKAIRENRTFIRTSIMKSITEDRSQIQWLN
jgi:hypothetical protein